MTNLKPPRGAVFLWNIRISGQNESEDMTPDNTPTIRPARASDVAVLSTMIAQLAEHHGDRAQISEEDLIFLCFCPYPWLSLLVAEQEGTVVGYAAFQRKVQLQFARRLMEVQHLFVLPELRGSGIGRALIKEITAQAALHRCEGLSLGVMVQNNAAQGFYTGLGFEPARGAHALQMIRRFDLQGAPSAP